MRPFIVAALMVSLATPAMAQAPVRREAGALVTENVPETPPQVREALRRYQNARSASFMDWLPDGSMLIATRFGSTPQLHHVKEPGGDRTQLTFFDEPIAGAEARPTPPAQVVFSRDTGGDEYFQSYASGLSGPETQITEPATRNTSMVFSPLGDKLAWSRVTPGSGDYDIMVMESGDVRTRRVALEGEGAVFPIAFDRDAKRLLLGRSISSTASKRYLLDLATGRLTELNRSRAEIAYSGGEFTPDGRFLLMLSDEGADVQRLIAFDLSNGRKTPVADGGKWNVESFDLSDDGRLLAWSINEEGRSKVAVRDFLTRRALPQPKLPTGVLTALRFTAAGKRLAIGLNTSTAPADVWAWDVQAGELVRWTNSEAGGLDLTQMVEPDLIRFKSFDGREIPAWIYKPKTPVGRAPVIIDVHGGPEAQARPGFNTTYQHWAKELGAVVIVPNVRGSDGYGKAYLKLDNAEKREDSVKDIGALLGWIATQPDLDASRVVVSGGSYGGYMTLASFARYNDRLAGAIDSVGISNWVTFLTNTEGYRRDLRRAEYGDERDPKMRALLEKMSPLAMTGEMKKPLFVIAGYNDPRVPWTEGRQMVEKVRANGGEVWWMMARDEGHGFKKKANRDALREAETMFLRKVFALDPSPGTAEVAR